jgi:phenylpropionate dioxygenase-like ring-hydroxylating dioxygenase large terminal subunit
MVMGWIPIALGTDVPTGATRGAVLEGRELVIWRGADGEAHVWEDRCPHRGMRLSFGFVRENALNCLYHGWQYGAGAQCMRIPAHPDLTVPASIRANAYTVAEAGWMIWTRLDRAGDGPVLDLPTSIEPLASIAVDAGPEAIATAAGTSVADGAPLFSLPHGDMVLCIGWHSVHADKTMLHAVVEAGGDRQSAMRRLRELRAAAEQGAAA